MGGLWLLIFAAVAALGFSETITLDTPLGTVEGNRTDYADVYRGLPFAQPPVGELRLRRPVPISTWGPGVLQALDDAPGCPQYCQLPKVTCPPTQSEDCLYLNVFTPHDASPSNRKAVMVFIHGGDYNQGYVGGVLYDGQAMARDGDVVVVVLQYRLGALGFLYGDGIDTNVGFFDQVAALQWVQQYIAAFGGDPDTVTIFGQSAGAISVACHLSSPASDGLFHRAIIESSPWSLSLRSRRDAQSFTRAYAKKLNCQTRYSEDAECLRSLSVDRLVAAQLDVQDSFWQYLHNPLQIGLPWTPVFGLPELPDHPINALIEGRVKDVPLIIGTVSEEGVAFAMKMFDSPLNWITYDLITGFLFGVDNFLTLAPKYSPEHIDMRQTLGPLITDGIFGCPARNTTRSLAASKSRKSPTYLYVFDHVMSFGSLVWGKWDFCYNHVCHSEELPFVFNSPLIYGVNCTGDELNLMAEMISRWTSFARHGNPEVSGMPNWPAYDNSQSVSYRFSAPTSGPQRAFRQDYCELWDIVGFELFQDKNLTDIHAGGLESVLPNLGALRFHGEL